MMTYKNLLNVALVSTSCLLIPSYGFAKGGKDLPLKEREEYYNKKAALTQDTEKKAKYEEKAYQAYNEKEKIEEKENFRKSIQENLRYAKGIAVDCNPTFTMKFVSPLPRCNYRNYLETSWDFDGKTQQEKGSMYAECGGHFQTVKILSKDEVQEMYYSYEYALHTFAPKLEALTGLPIKQIRGMSAYGLNYLIHEYFESVAKPQDGDLVVYSEHEDSHAGIFRVTDQGEVVESWWRMWSNPFVFQHDMFCVPGKFGNKARVYRIKQELKKITQEEVQNVPLMATLREDGVFIFDGTEENRSIRKFVTTNKMVDVQAKYPNLFKVKNSLKFFGVCYGYAMGRVMKTYECPSPSVVPYFECDPVKTLNFLNTYFEITTEPKEGDFVIYYNEDPVENPYSWKHFGEYIGNNLVDSKWGSDSVAIHPLFFADELDGDFVRILRKKMPAEEILKRLIQEKEAKKVDL